jgi:DNA-binding winged helix-turn-helix (wHTH) protein
MGDEAGRDALYKFGVFRLDAKTQILTKEGTKVDLDAKPIQVLLTLLESAGVLVSRKDLLKKVWGGTSVSRDSIYQHISVLRKVLGESRNDNKYIMTVPRGGYQFLAPVEIITPIEHGEGDLINEETEVFTVEADEDYGTAYETVEGGTANFTTAYETVEAGTVDFVNSDKTAEGTDESHVYPCQTAKADENLHRKRPSTKRPQKKRK